MRALEREKRGHAKNGRGISSNNNKTHQNHLLLFFFILIQPIIINMKQQPFYFFAFCLQDSTANRWNPFCSFKNRSTTRRHGLPFHSSSVFTWNNGSMEDASLSLSLVHYASLLIIIIALKQLRWERSDKYYNWIKINWAAAYIVALVLGWRSFA